MINERRARPDKKKVRKSQRVPHRREKFDAASARTIFVTLRLPASSALRKSEPSTRVLCQRFYEKLEQENKKNYASAFLFDREKHLQIKTGCTVKECSPCKKLDPSPDLFGQQCYKNNKENTRGIEKRRRFVSG
jgi:hypothetical protein